MKRKESRSTGKDMRSSSDESNINTGNTKEIASAAIVNRAVYDIRHVNHVQLAYTQIYILTNLNSILMIPIFTN